MVERHRLTDKQIAISIDILRAGKVSLSKESASDYVEAASFIFDKGLMLYPGALEMLQAVQSRRAALQAEDADHG